MDYEAPKLGEGEDPEGVATGKVSTERLQEALAIFKDFILDSNDPAAKEGQTS